MNKVNVLTIQDIKYAIDDILDHDVDDWNDSLEDYEKAIEVLKKHGLDYEMFYGLDYRDF